jgi:hypothetical protein
LIVPPEPLLVPVMLPVIVPITQVKVLGEEAVKLITRLASLQIVAVFGFVTTVHCPAPRKLSDNKKIVIARYDKRDFIFLQLLENISPSEEIRKRLF